MRVYQFRHIRARRQCSPEALQATRTMAGVKRGLAVLVAALAAAPAAHAADVG